LKAVGRKKIPASSTVIMLIKYKIILSLFQIVNAYFLYSYSIIKVKKRKIMEDKTYKTYLDNGIYDIQDGKYLNAIENINKSLELKNDWEIPYFYRAVAYQAMEEFDNAMLDYTKALHLNNKMTDAYYNRAYITLSRKDIENPDVCGAVKDLEQALKLDENFIDALYAMAAAQKKLENYDKALEYLDRLLEIEPEAVNAKALKKLIVQKYL